MYPRIGTSRCPPLPSTGSRLGQFPRFIGTMGFYDPSVPVPASFGLPCRRGTAHRRRRGGLPRSRRIPVRACPGLGTPAARREPRITVPAIQPSVRLTTSASATRKDFGAESARPAPSLSTLHLAGRPARCKTRYRPARYGVDRAGFTPAGFHQEVSRAHDVPPLPRLVAL